MFEQKQLSLEHKLFVMTHSGLLEVFLGLIFLGFGIGILSDTPWLGGILVPLMTPGLISSQNALFRRMPQSDIATRESSHRHSLLLLVFLGFLILGVLFGLFMMSGDGIPGLAGLRDWLADNLIIGFGLLWAGLLAGCWFATGAARFGAYSGLAVLVGLILQISQIEFPLSPIVTGAILILLGSVQIIRTLRTTAYLE